jgi:hypothetical protein
MANRGLKAKKKPMTIAKRENNIKIKYSGVIFS